MSEADNEEIRGVLGFEEEPAFNEIDIKIASPDVIRQWSHGEVRSPETINYRTYKPEPDGLFCQKVFGPIVDYECACGKYKRIKYKGVFCERCGVEVTQASVRRERMGHIELTAPVVHILFFKAIGALLELPLKDVERIAYYESYVVTDPGVTPLTNKQILSEQELNDARNEHGFDSFVADIGGSAIKTLLKNLDLAQEIEAVRMSMANSNSQQVRRKLANRLMLLNNFANSKVSPDWMVLDVLPVIPPDLRPLVPLEGGRFATSDLNDLYRRVINRNNRLKGLLSLKTPNIIIYNEKRMLQEAVDALFANGSCGTRPAVNSTKRPLKSLTDMLKGKNGRFRQNLLGKRVDYSGRSVIVVGPELKINQCGLPKKMALVLFEPFVICRLKELGFASTVRVARKMIKNEQPEVWDILADVVREHPILLNRAPTLHRLSIQAFEPLLIESDAIQLHPLVCGGFNADFDGDQMGVHVPLSTEAVLEAYMLMLSTNNIFSPANGKPILMPSQDVVLGNYVLTAAPIDKPAADKVVPLVNDLAEAKRLELCRILTLHDWVDIPNPDYQKETPFGVSSDKYIRTTIGRIIFNEIWPKGMGFINDVVNKDKLSKLINESYRFTDAQSSVTHLDALKQLGFTMATRMGVSIGIDDMAISDKKAAIIEENLEKIKTIQSQFERGIITDKERYSRVISIWSEATDAVASVVFKNLEKHQEGALNPLFVMMDSGARGNKQQVRQLCGMRGLMAKPSGEIIEYPILSSFREGLNPLEYFTSAHGARKGMADTALRTADAGYLTRKLIDVAMNCIINKTSNPIDYSKGITKQAIYNGDEEMVSLAERIIGRYACDNIADPNDPKRVIIHQGDKITESQAKEITALGIDKVKIVSPLTHMDHYAIPPEAYGDDLSTHDLVAEGVPVGIIAAQSIGEPGTQLTLWTFHSGGVASHATNSEYRAKCAGRVKYEDVRCIRTQNTSVAINKTGIIHILSDKGAKLETFHVQIGSVLMVADGDLVKAGDVLVMWDANHIPILADQAGIVRYKDLYKGITFSYGQEGENVRVIIEHPNDLNPSIEIVDKQGTLLGSYPIPVGSQLMVNDGDRLVLGALIAKTPRLSIKTQDITGGLPRITELFEIRTPKDAAIMARSEGIVSFDGVVRNKKRLLITNPATQAVETHLIPYNKQLFVQEGDFVKKGQCLTDGAIDPHEMLSIFGVRATQEYLLNEIQKVYHLQGVSINDKHLEIVIAFMFSKVCITDAGDTEFLLGDLVERCTFDETNASIIKMGGNPAKSEPVLLGITKSALNNEGFISAASFQETTRILTEAAIMNRHDNLSGFKENVITGNLIPAGTGLNKYRSMRIHEIPNAVAAEA